MPAQDEAGMRFISPWNVQKGAPLDGVAAMLCFQEEGVKTAVERNSPMTLIVIILLILLLGGGGGYYGYGRWGYGGGAGIGLGTILLIVLIAYLVGAL